MQLAATRLPWHVTLPNGLHGEALDRLIAWCRAEVDPGDWFYPIAGADFAFAQRGQAEALAAETIRIYGASPALRDARVSQTPPWAGGKR